MSRLPPLGESSVPRHSGVGRWKVLGLGLAILAAAMLGLVGIARISSIDAIKRTFATLTTGVASDPRWEEGRLIIDRWATSPLFGYGTGATLPGYQRSADYPWAFELSYHVVLLDFGLFGLVLLLLWGLWILAGLRRGLRTISDSALAGSLLCAFISTAIAIFSDPYVQKFDGMWMVFIPFGAAVYWWAQRPSSPDLEQRGGRE